MKLLVPTCPACHKGKLFSGLLQVAAQCNACGLDLQKHEQGDGPAFFVITLLGFVVTGLAVAVEVLYTPPLWGHALLWVPLIVILSVWLLRIFKAWIIREQYKRMGL